MGIWALRKRVAAWGARLVSDASASLRGLGGLFGASKLVPKEPAEEAPEERAKNVAAERSVDLGGGVTLELVLVPAGSFRMGSEKGDLDEKPVHEVRFGKPFYMGKYPVTQEQWQAVMGSKPSCFEGAKNPVEYLTWDDCQRFLGKLNRRTGFTFALPSEAEWEYACRAGSTTEFCFGDEEAGLDDYAWYSGNSGDRAHPVGRKKPNAWGLHDMHGNVQEWCQDGYLSRYSGAPSDGTAWLGGGWGDCVLRGGCYYLDPWSLRSARRRSLHPGARHDWVGFRVVWRSQE